MVVDEVLEDELEVRVVGLEDDEDDEDEDGA